MWKFCYTVLGVAVLLLNYGCHAKLSKRGVSQKLDVTLLYESLCPDSQRFMYQLAPVFDELHNYINIEMVPFGKSHSEADGAIFQCQHGPSECLGNRLQNCVLSSTNNQAAQVKFVVCQMLSREYNNIEKCARAAGLSSDISQCADTNLGTNLQLEAEKKTHYYRPTFVPTVVYNGVFNQQLQDLSQRNFRGTVCHVLRTQNLLDENEPVCR